MSQWFSDASSDESDVERIEEDNQTFNPRKGKGAIYYLPDTDDESKSDDDLEEGPRLTPEEKEIDGLHNICDTLKSQFDREKSWYRAEELFEVFFKAMDAHLRVGSVDQRPVPQVVDEVKKCIEMALEADKDRSKDEFDSHNDFKAFRRLSKLYAEIKDEYVYEGAVDAADASPDEKEDMAQTLLAKLMSSTKFDLMRKEAINLKLPQLVATIVALQAQHNIDKEKGSVSMSITNWKKTYKLIVECFNLTKSSGMKVKRSGNIETLRVEDVKTCYIQGGISSLFVSLTDAVIRILQNTTTENAKLYLECIKAESTCITFGQTLLKSLDPAERPAVAASLINLSYGRSTNLHEIISRQLGIEDQPLTLNVWWDICNKSNDKRLDIPGMFLRYCYHVALNGDIEKCRVLMEEEKASKKFRLFSSGPGMELLEGSSVSHRIHFVRIIVQLGLSSFQVGQLDDCRELLTKVLETKGLKEYRWSWTVLLGQQIPYVQNENERIKTQILFSSVQIPLHLHISETSVEHIFYLCHATERAVAMSKSPFERSNLGPERFKEFVKKAQHSNVAGPPQTEKELVYHVFSSIQCGDWAKASKYLNSMILWKNLVKGDVARQHMERKVKEACLKVFLFTEAVSFERISVPYLKSRFDIDDELTTIVRAALDEQDSPLVAFWDFEESHLVVDRCSVSRLHNLVSSAATATHELERPSELKRKPYFNRH
eukprot:Tbor_TRINITY_DN8237_c0_g1::TRINITY_DN8237_c0_g1_i1::g.15382::m.15382/K03252/EIF3C; translation initiation factor 3 subunit C